MSKIMMVTGGARSGKSSFAESKVHELAESRKPCKVVYLATATSCDDEMAHRIAKHRASRPSEWITIEQFQDFQDLDLIFDLHEAKVILLDCLGFMLNNIMFYNLVDFEDCAISQFEEVEKNMLLEIEKLVELVRRKDLDLVVVTNEVGMSLVPPDQISRYYRDILGRANRTMAAISDEVVLVVAGIALNIK